MFDTKDGAIEIPFDPRLEEIVITTEQSNL
jgi:hypothetical protein